MASHHQPESPLELQAEAFIQEGRFEEAEHLYRTLVEAGSEQPRVYGNLAALCGMGGRYQDMVSLLKKALELNPAYPEALYNLGLAYGGLGDKKAAITSYQQAINLKPDYPDAHYNLGNTLQEQGNPKGAIAAYNKAIHHRPNHPKTHFNLGIAYKSIGDLNGAIAAYTHALKHKPDYPDAHYNLANCHLEIGNFEAAVASYQAALRLNADHPDAHANLGNAFLELGQVEQAIEAFSHALQRKPHDPKSHTNLGHALQERGDLGEAIAAYKQALRLKPDDASTHNNLGCALQEQGQMEAALAAFHEALKLSPNHPDAHNNLGTALESQGELDSAIAAYNAALHGQPDHSQAHYNLGNALQKQGQLTEAIASYGQALKHKDKRIQVHRNLSMTLLLAGNYKEGWDLYESRLEPVKADQETVLHAKPSCGRWDGRPLPAGEKLLLVSEQGLGDTLQFMRYALHLRDHCGLNVSLCADPKLHPLIQASGIDAHPLTPAEATSIREGYWVPLLSVPRHLNVSPRHPLITAPYIRPPEAAVKKWGEILSNEKRPLIALNWQGNPAHETTHSKGRSLPLETFAPLVQRCDVNLLSIQKGWGSEQLDGCSFRDRFCTVQALVNDTWDFLETAAILANCDLVITSDTSVVHLAGGMGAPTWLLLKKVPEWRWGMTAEDSFWYPSVRLFRQREMGDWSEVLERVADALQATPPSPGPPQQAIGVKVAISLGELIDKLTILEIKREHLQGKSHERARNNVDNEYQHLQEALCSLPTKIDPRLIHQLKEVNADLWRIEDEIRAKERQKDFGETFIRLARSVYQQNDRRAAIKREINTTHGSQLLEEKFYDPY